MAVTAAAWGLLALLALRRGGRGVLPERAEIRWALGTMAIPAWMLALAWTQSCIHGGTWTGDWNEHYRRTLYFLDRLQPGESLEFGVTDRPPLLNLVAAAWSTAVGESFPDFQIVHLTLSSFAALPALLLLQRLSGRSSSAPRPLALFALVYLLHPAIAAHTLYTWTRMLAAFFVLGALYFYLLFDQERREPALAWAGLAAGLAIVTHYSAVVPVALLAAHLAWREGACILKPGRLGAYGAGLLPVGLWMFWAVRDFGWRATLLSNTTAQSYERAGVERVVSRWGYNLLTTLVPFWDRAGMQPYYLQASRAGEWSDALHMYWVSTLLGSVSTALALACLLCWLRRPVAMASAFRREEARALLVAGAFALLLSLPLIPSAEVAGFAHLTLLPVAILICIVGVAWILSSGAQAERLLVALLTVEGLLFYGLKTFDRTVIPVSRFGFGYTVNKRLQDSHQLTLLFDRDPAFAGYARAALLVGIVGLCLFCLVARRDSEGGGVFGKP